MSLKVGIVGKELKLNSGMSGKELKLEIIMFFKDLSMVIYHVNLGTHKKHHTGKILHHSAIKYFIITREIQSIQRISILACCNRLCWVKRGNYKVHMSSQLGIWWKQLSTILTSYVIYNVLSVKAWVLLTNCSQEHYFLQDFVNLKVTQLLIG